MTFPNVGMEGLKTVNISSNFFSSPKQVIIYKYRLNKLSANFDTALFKAVCLLGIGNHCSKYE